MRRLLEDSQLPGAVRGDLMRARSAGHDYPAAAKLLQLRAAMSERAPSTNTEALRSWPTRALHSGWKLGALVVLGAGAAFLAQPATSTSPAPDASPQPPAADTALARAPAAAPAPQPTADPAAVTEPATNQPSPPPTAAVKAAAAPSASKASSSRREIAQLVQIRALLARDPVAAHRLAERSELEFPRGLLSEERRALAIVALANMGSKQLAEQGARRYFARYPHSPLRTMIEAALQR